MAKYEERYRYDAITGEYVGMFPFVPRPGATPAENTTDVRPDFREGFAPFWHDVKNDWNYVEDHRGQTIYRTIDEGIATGTMQAPGAVPDGWTSIPPPPRKPGWLVQWKNGEWAQTENHVGKVGYVDGKEVMISELGPLPEGWSTDAPPAPPYVPPPDTRTPKEKRATEYRKRIDPIVRQIAGYREEANAWEEREDVEKSEAAMEKADLLLEDLLDQKEAIRAEFPDEEEK